MRGQYPDLGRYEPRLAGSGGVQRPGPGDSGGGPGTVSAGPLCNVDTTVAWRNTTTGAAGEYRLNVVSGIYGSIQYAEFQNTGPGHIEVTVTTNNLNIPAHGAFDVS
ncbi:hypothetical protein [Nocardia africana]|uniref:Uncharacterized protein n=1 Tax=Nocardia africana TaxID=134964 RepID=A0A378X5N9_9NOCA|nr:hypothetical protein [Nocardia africana]SUA47853.1 Uncharacterised protein [Nocardia africana]